MAEWLIEEGIGETRAILLANGEPRAARLFVHGETRAGEVSDAVLLARQSGARRGTVRLPTGEEALIDALPRNASEGALLRVLVTRAAIREGGRIKRAQVRPSERAAAPAPAPLARLEADGLPVRITPRFPGDPWSDLMTEALEGQVPFEGGALLISPTPAMTLIDIDGTLPPAALAMAAIDPIASALRRFDIGGSIGIDFPTLERKDERRAIDTALAQTLDDWPHQSTAMNGFGFVQLVARCEGPSLLHRVRSDRVGSAARLLLRRAERVDEAGVLLLSAHPAVRKAISQDWEEQLIRRTGRTLRWNLDPTLALHAGFAQALST